MGLAPLNSWKETVSYKRGLRNRFLMEKGSQKRSLEGLGAGCEGLGDALGRSLGADGILEALLGGQGRFWEGLGWILGAERELK